MTRDWTVIGDRGRTAVVRRDFADAFREAGLLRAADVDPEKLCPEARPFRPSAGRGPLARVPAGELGDAVVRPYRRGGLAARLVEARYLLGDRAFRELRVTLRLRRAGVPTVEPLAAVRSTRCRGLGYRAALATRFVSDARPAASADPGEAGGRPDAAGGRPGEAGGRPDAGRGAGSGNAPVRTALRRMGRATRRLHDAGGLHPDLNVHNFLLPDSPRRPAVLLDFDRARKLPFPLPGPLRGRGTRRLRRSLAKLGLDRMLDAWSAFEKGYREG